MSPSILAAIQDKHILFLGNSTSYFLSHRLPVAKGLLEAGARLTVVAPDDGNHQSAIEAMGIRYIPITLSRRGMNPLQEWCSYKEMLHVLAKEKPDIAYLTTIKPVLYGGIAARVAKLPALVSVITGMGYVFLQRGWKASIIRMIVKQCYRLACKHPNQMVVFQNEEDRAFCVQENLLSQEKTVIIKGSGVDVNQYKPAPEPDGPPVVMLASRMLWHKGIEFYIEAATWLKQKGVHATFWLVGEGDQGNPASIDSLKLQLWHDESNIQWLGRQHDMPDLFAKCHIVCLPSFYREGVPKVLIEAASCGKPIVTTDMPGCRDIVEHKISGIIVPPKDSQQLAEALEALIYDKDLRLRYGQAGRNKVKAEFSTEVVVAKMLEVVARLLK